MDAEHCNYPGCKNPLPPYRGQGPRRKYCDAHKGYVSPEHRRELNQRSIAKRRVERRLESEASRVCAECGNDLPAGRRTFCSDECSANYWRDESIEQYEHDERARWNAEIEMRRITLVYDPTGDFRPGARFTIYDILASGNQLERKDTRYSKPFARDCWAVGTRFEILNKAGRNIYVVGDDMLMQRVAT